MEFKNFAYGTVLTAPSPATSGTTLVLDSGQGANFPSVFPYNIIIWPTGYNPTSVNAEIAKVTARSSDTLTIVRAQEGTSARTVIVGDQVMFALTGESLRRLEGHWSIVQSAVSLTNSITTAQNALPSGQSSFAAEANTLYEIEFYLDIRTGSTSHSVGFLLGGTATFNFVKTWDDAYKGGLGATVTANNSMTRNAATNLVETPANTTANTGLKGKGIIRVTNSGSIIPQIQFSSGPTGTCQVQVGSYVKFKKIGIDTLTVIGDWS